MALLTVRITSEDGTVRELKLEPGAQIEVAEGDKVEVLDSEGRPIEISVDEDNENNVKVTIVAEQQQTVIIDGIVRGGGAEAEEFIFENLALYIEDETGSSIAFFDPDIEEVTVVASIEDLLAGISTAAGDGGDGTQGTFGFSPEAVQNIPNLGDGPGIPGQDPPIAINFVPEADQSDIAEEEEAAPPEPISGVVFITASGADGEGNLTAEDALEGQFIRVVASVDIAPVGTPLVLTLSPSGTLEGEGSEADDFTVTIEVGAFAGGVFFPAQGDDVFVDFSTEMFRTSRRSCTRSS